MLKRSLSVKRAICLIFCVLFILLSFCGCSDNLSESTSDKVTFTDALGREVSVEKNPERVACLIGSFADVWALAGGTVCAASEDAWEDFEINLDNAVNIGGAHSPDIEKLISSEPELVIASASTAADIEMKDSLEKMGITAVYFDVDSFDDYLNMLNICTDITGRKDLYKKNGTELSERINEIKSNFSDLNLTEEKRTVLLLRASSGFVKAKGSEGTVLGEMLKDIGCINIADSDKTVLENLSIESIVRENPCHIFVVAMGDDTEAARDSLSKLFSENPLWNTLKAVKENRLHYMDKKLFNLKPNARWSEAYEILVELFK